MMHVCVYYHTAAGTYNTHHMDAARSCHARSSSLWDRLEGDGEEFEIVCGTYIIQYMHGTGGDDATRIIKNENNNDCA